MCIYTVYSVYHAVCVYIYVCVCIYTVYSVYHGVCVYPVYSVYHGVCIYTVYSVYHAVCIYIRVCIMLCVQVGAVVMQRSYSRGGLFLTAFPDGSAQILYPSLLTACQGGVKG